MLRSGAGNDTVVGTAYDDRIDSGLGNDTVTGGDGLDTFTDAGGNDTLVESFDRDFFLSDDPWSIGRVVGRSAGTGFASGIVEDLGGIFEHARLDGFVPGRRPRAANTFLIGDADGVARRPGGTAHGRPAGPARSPSTRGAGDDLVVVSTRDSATSTGSTVDVNGGTGTDRLVLDGTASARTSSIGRQQLARPDHLDRVGARQAPVVHDRRPRRRSRAS